MPLRPLLPLCWLAACGPSDDALRELASVRLGNPPRTVPIGVIAPDTQAERCCCPDQGRWFEMKDQPESCDVYPDATEADRYFRGTTHLDVDCLVKEGYLAPAEVARRTVRCADVRCDGGSGSAPLGEAPKAEVLVPTAGLKALLDSEDGVTWNLRLGKDRLGEVLERDRRGLSELSVTFALVEDETPLNLCVIERRSRPPPKNRKASYVFERNGLDWR